MNQHEKWHLSPVGYGANHLIVPFAGLGGCHDRGSICAVDIFIIRFGGWKPHLGDKNHLGSLSDHYLSDLCQVGCGEVSICKGLHKEDDNRLLREEKCLLFFIATSGTQNERKSPIVKGGSVAKGRTGLL